MIFVTVTGRITKDAALRQAGSQPVCGFSIASNKKTRDGDVATFIDASIWGKRGQSLVQYLKKGTSVTAVGELSTREHNGKTYLSVNVQEIDFSGGGNRAEPPEPREGPATSGSDDSDSIPF